MMTAELRPTQMTPAQIDTTIADLEDKIFRLTRDRKYAEIRRDRTKAYAVHPKYAADEVRQVYFRQNIDKAEGEIENINAKIADLDTQVQRFNHEYIERGRWNRYFLVTSSIGHVHRERTCSTCLPTTQYAWLPQLSDCVESDMVDQYGEKACTVCFPNAPVHPAFIRSVEEREAAEAAKAAKRCPGTTATPETESYSRRYVECATCGRSVAVTRNGYLRAHDR